MPWRSTRSQRHIAANESQQIYQRVEEVLRKKNYDRKRGKKNLGGTRKMRNEMFYKSGKLKPFSSALPFRFVGFRWFEFES